MSFVIRKYSDTFVDKLGKEDRVSVPPIKVEIDKRNAEQMCPVNHIKPYDVPFHLPAKYEKEVMDMLKAGIIQKCEVATTWNITAFHVTKSNHCKQLQLIFIFIWVG